MIEIISKKGFEGNRRQPTQLESHGVGAALGEVAHASAAAPHEGAAGAGGGATVLAGVCQPPGLAGVAPPPPPPPPQPEPAPVPRGPPLDPVA